LQAQQHREAGEQMSTNTSQSGAAYAFCVPHLPFMTMQARELNAGFWAAYEARARDLCRFNPEVVFVFGSDHYEGQVLRSMPAFMVGQAAEAVADRGGFPGPLNVPGDIALACAEYLVNAEFDVAISYAMQVDHGFSNVLHQVFGSIDAYPVVPIFVNALIHPRPTFRRCRRFGEAVGRFAATLGRRVAFVGSGGLSHETGEVFPQIEEVRDEATRDFLIHGGLKGTISREQWRINLDAGLEIVNGLLMQRTPGVGNIKPEWDEKFLKMLTSQELTSFDAWEDDEVYRSAGNGAGEVREWIAALAAAKAAGAGNVVVDHYEVGTCIGVAAAVVHAPARSTGGTRDARNE
jgi:2,3-dihydroxyphenylpropionate 1,2-dioxygenase